MAELVADCPRCGAKKITFDLTASTQFDNRNNWQAVYEAFCVCRHCGRSTVFVVSANDAEIARFLMQHGLAAQKGCLNDVVNVEDYISLKNTAAQLAPQHLPLEIESAFDEGATCLAAGCPNAAAVMFRLCLDRATLSLLPEKNENDLNEDIRRSLGRRLQWLFGTGRLPAEFRELSTCIKEDGNDAAHAGTVDKSDAEELLDFATALLERLYTEPARLRLAKEKRLARRAPKGQAAIAKNPSKKGSDESSGLGISAGK